MSNDTHMDWEDCVTNPPNAGETWSAEQTTLIQALLETDRPTNSPYNPERLTNNCVFVTLAYLLRTNARELCDRIGIRPEAESYGVSLDTAVRAIESLGIQFRVVRFIRPNIFGGGIRDAGMHESRISWRGWPRHRVGVAYQRPDRSGHVVVCNSPGTPYRRYVDYQRRAAGQDVTREVQSGRVYMIFAVDWQRSRGSFFNALRRQEEQEQEQQRRQEEEQKQRENNGFYGGRFHDEL